MMRKTVGMLLVAVCVLGVMSGMASAKDEVLLQDMVTLEKTYIPPLFLTSQPDKLPAARKAMLLLRSAWNGFSAGYYDYRPDYANWQVYFDTIEYAIQDAEAVVDSVTPENPEALVLAHDALEGVRLAMLDLRSANGFPKFITDKLTVYHDPMESIVLALKNEPMSPALLEFVAETYVAAEKAWSVVEKCPVDPGLWGFGTEKMLLYYARLAEERAALDRLAAALESGDALAVKQAGTLPLKQPFVDTYTMFGDFSPYQPAAQ